MLDPARYRQRLIDQLVSLSDDGLENLALRLARDKYPDAFRTAPGADGGVDVLSDREIPPERGWQAKNQVGKIDWDDCRNSLSSAMLAEDEPAVDAPGHYTFVFPRPLTKGSRKFWSQTFVPEQKRRYPHLKTLDLWDDLASRVADHPKLIEKLSDGAFSEYIRPVLAMMKQDGVNPLAKAVDVAEGAASVSAHAATIGADDPLFAYGVSGWHAGAGDDVLPDGRGVFAIEHGAEAGLPRYTLTLRESADVTETSAKPALGAEVTAPTLWFAQTPEGEQARQRIRASLAKGQPIRVGGSEVVGLDPGDVPDLFDDQTDADGLLRRGSMEVGLSEPLALTIGLQTPDGTPKSLPAIPLYRVPEPAKAISAWAGAVGGCVIGFDVNPYDGDDGPAAGEDQRELVLDVTLAVGDEPPTVALAGLGFVQALGQAANLTLECPGLLPDGGIEVDGLPAPSAEATEVWQTAAWIATALALLNRRDGGARAMPEAVNERDTAVAEIVCGVLGAGARVAIPDKAEEFKVGLDPATDPTADPASLLESVKPLPKLCGYETDLLVAQSVTGAEAVEIVIGTNGRRELRCRRLGAGAAINLTLAGPAHHVSAIPKDE